MSLKSEGVKISLVPGSLTIDDAAGKENRVHISVANTEMPEQELNGLKLRGSINDITIKMVTEDGTTRNLTAFNTPLEISFAYDTNADEEKLGIYYYNEEQRQWEFIGGNINREDNYIYAEVNHLSKYAVMEFEKTFADITQHWARRSIEVMAAKHITRGLTETQFGPGKMVTRAEFATLLVKTLGLKPRGVDVFKDVPADAWYNGGVRAAYHAGLVEGRGEGRFDPSAPITRQEMASLIIKAYMNKTGENLNEHRTSQEIRFTDEQHVASWAHWSVILANALGLMQGFGDESFRPEETSTRAQAIVVLKKLYDIEK